MPGTERDTNMIKNDFKRFGKRKPTNALTNVASLDSLRKNALSNSPQRNYLGSALGNGGLTASVSRIGNRNLTGGHTDRAMPSFKDRTRDTLNRSFDYTAPPLGNREADVRKSHNIISGAEIEQNKPSSNYRKSTLMNDYLTGPRQVDPQMY